VVLHGPGLRCRLGQCEEHDHLAGGHCGHAGRPEVPPCEHTDERGRHELADQHHEEERTEEPLRMVDQPSECLTAPAVLGSQRGGASRGHARQARLGHRQECGQAHEHDDRNDQRGVCAHIAISPRPYRAGKGRRSTSKHYMAAR
jgi:hypothetical protein